MYRKYYSVKAFIVPMRDCQMLAAIVQKRGGKHLQGLKKKKEVPFVDKTPLSLHSPEKKKIPQLKLLLLLCINIISLCVAVGWHLRVGDVVWKPELSQILLSVWPRAH